MFSTSLATMRFHFILDLTLSQVAPNHLTISYRHGRLPSCCFRSQIPLDNNSDPPVVYEPCDLSGPADFCFRYTVITPLSSDLPCLDVLTQRHFQYRPFRSPLCRDYFLFFLLCGISRFSYV